MSVETLMQGTAVLVALTLAAASTRWLVMRPNQHGPIDHPNARSLHTTPVPRSGGLAVLLGCGVPLLLMALLGIATPELAWTGLALLLVAAVSYRDDLGGLARRWRLLAQALAAVLLMSGGLIWSRLDLPGWALDWPLPVALLLTLLYVVWMINLYNFMDGMDGFAGGMAVFGFTAFAVLGWSGGEPLFALAAACIAAAAAGFLTSNFPPARIFLGDVGSSSLGLLVAAFSLWGVGLGLFPLWSAWLAFSPFIVDATWTLLARLARRERIWEPHRSHHYQRLVLAGWTHHKTALRGYLVMAGAAACAVAAPALPPHEQWLLIAAWGAIYLLIHAKVRLVERRAQAERA
ncbi:MAG: glycosyltransferase family 4 protein [Sphingobacteriia bacterium]|nr:glycosyltransferase family 4 protein [Sphingobacteriia bacterium]NCC38676.1 glycosyltransferase family 4 protein [Gammaproteobacteria bacterium]